MGNAAYASTPTAALRQALSDLLVGGSFRFDRKTRDLIKEAEQALRAVKPVVAHEKAVGLFCYDKTEHAFLPVTEERGIDVKGNLRPGCEYLFRQPPSLVPMPQEA